MKQLPSISRFIVIFFLMLTSSPVLADMSGKPVFNVKAKAAVLINSVSGQIVFEQDADKPIPPASLTKLMTLFLAYDAIENGSVTLQDPVRISKKAWKTGGSRMFLRVGTSVVLEKILTGIAVVSGNDACVALAEHISGVEEVFVEAMNKKAALLGMNKTVFIDSNGLSDEGQTTTARDMAVLAYAYIEAHPAALKIHAIKKMTYNKITQPNRNGLLWLDYGVDGLKTGQLESAGFHLTATAPREGDRFIAVVMGAQSVPQRENIALKLLNYGFRNYKTSPVVASGSSLVQVPVWKGAADKVALGIDRTVFLTIPIDKIDAVYIEKDYPDRIFAPVSEGQVLGQVRVLIDLDEIKSLHLTALAAVERAGFFKSMWHSLLLFFVRPPFWGALIVAVFMVVFVTAFIFAARGGKKKRVTDNNIG